MRAWGEGTIQKLPNGKYRGVGRVDGKRVFGPTVVRRADALPALWQKVNRSQPDENEPTLSICVQRKLDSMRLGSDYSPTTIDLWANFERKLLASPIADLTPSDVEEADVELAPGILVNMLGRDLHVRRRGHYVGACSARAFAIALGVIGRG